MFFKSTEDRMEYLLSKGFAKMEKKAQLTLKLQRPRKDLLFIGLLLTLASLYSLFAFIIH